jgi:hypothetical protein
MKELKRCIIHTNCDSHTNREVLMYLESMGYHLNNTDESLLRNYNQTIFRIKSIMIGIRPHEPEVTYFSWDDERIPGYLNFDYPYDKKEVLNYLKEKPINVPNYEPHKLIRE